MAKFTLDDFLQDDEDQEPIVPQESPSELPSSFNPATHKSGYVALVGKPNAGKSTLMNALVGSRLSIVSHKPQTTRNRVIGILSDENSQVIFLDTPGIINPKYRLHEVMMGYVQQAGEDADVVFLLVDASDTKWDHTAIFEQLKKLRAPVFLIINKIDLVTQELAQILLEQFNEQFKFKGAFAISALEGSGVVELKKLIKEYLPLGPPFYPKDQLSEHPERFFVSEMIREQIFLQYEQEIPYSCAVDIIQYQETETIDHIDADIIVERDSQKGILIGKGGIKLKRLGTAARKEIETFIGKRIHLKLFVKVREKWREKESFLRGLGYNQK
ncbi:GTPase Era [bacterium]|nr:MAG: GTPase Era [bacterium]